MGGMFIDKGVNHKGENTVTDELTGEVVERKLVSLNGCLYVCIPRKFVTFHNLRKGDLVPVVMSAGHVKIIPYEKKDGSGSSG
jgi:hypothetical protein